MKKKLNLGVLSTLGSTIGGANTKVVIGSSTYCTKRGSSWLMSVALNQYMTERDLNLVHGYIDHESGHIRFTEWSAIADSFAKGESVRHMTNVLEDIRIEGLIGKRYKGSAMNLHRMVSTLCEDESFWSIPTQGMGLNSLVNSFFLFGGRYHLLSQVAMKERADLAFSILKSRVSKELYFKFGECFLQLSNLTSTAGALKLAIEVLALIDEAKEEQQQQQQQQQQNDDEEGESDGQDSGNTDDTDDTDDTDSDAGNAGDTDGEDGDDEADGQAGGNSGGDDSDEDGDESSDQSNQAGENQSDVDGGNAQDQQTQGGGQSSNSRSEYDPERDWMWFDENGEEVIPKDICDGIAEAIDNRFNATFDPTEGDPFQESMTMKRDIARFACLYEVDNKAVQAAQTSLKKWCLSHSNRKTTPRTAGGKLNGRRLARLPAGNLRVFEHTLSTRTPSAAVQIMLDTSGSMYPTTHYGAGTACASLVKALQGLKDFSVSVIQFNDDCTLVHDWETKGVLGNLAMPCGGTETGPACYAAMGNLANRKEDTKLVFILTDGDGDLRQVIPKAKEYGIKVCAVRFGGGAIELIGLEPELQPYCEDMNRLPEMFTSVLQTVMDRS